MKTIRDIPVLENIPVLVRTALNVPLENGKVTNTFRLRATLETIEYLRKKHARIILCGHISGTGTETLLPVVEALKKMISGVSFCPVSTGPQAREMVRALTPGQVLVLENLRRNKGEEKNDPEFAKELAELADVFVQDSFDVCHRKHASVVGVPSLLPSYAGLTVEKELKELKKALRPKRAALAIIGGAKFSTKEPLLKELLKRYSKVFVGGALANDFLKQKGVEVGISLVSNADSAHIQKLLKSKKLLLPIDAIVAKHGKKRSEGEVKEFDQITSDEAILDIGPQTVEMLAPIVTRFKTVLWNGPLGNYENGFVDGTESVAILIAKSKAHSMIGGGDTIAAVEKLGLNDHFSFISTGGGAMLGYLVDGKLPGVEVLT